MPKDYNKIQVQRGADTARRLGMRCSTLVCLPLHALLLVAGTTQADEPAAAQSESAIEQSLAEPVITDGDSLAWAIYRRDNGRDSVVSGTMSLTTAKGRSRTRDLRIFQRTQTDGQETTLIRFATPASIAGTALLNSPGSNDMWIHLPALDRTRRISSSSSGGRFVNSQYFYEDLKERHPGEDRHTLIEGGDYEGIETLILVSEPKDPEESVYSLRRSWIHPEVLLPLRVDFYEDDDEPSKRLEVLEINEIEGYWTVMVSQMTDLRTMDRTTITVNAVRYNQNLPENLFTTTTMGVRSAYLPFTPQK